MSDDKNKLVPCGCDQHEGDFAVVHVKHQPSGTDWGLFWYCEKAVKEDTSRGLIVTAAAAIGESK